MINHATTEVFFDDLEVPAENLTGEEGKAFRYILDGINAERILIAAECVGDARWFVEKASAYARERVVFDRPIGRNQGVQFPIARAYAAAAAANLMVRQAIALYDDGQPCGAEANMAKLLAADVSWQAADTCLQCTAGSASPRSTTSSASSARPASTRSSIEPFNQRLFHGAVEIRGPATEALCAAAKKANWLLAA